MYRVSYEIVLHGFPEELKCITKLNEALNTMNNCVGTQTSFLCSYGDTLIKLIPYQQVQQFSPLQPQPQALSIVIHIEGEKVGNIIDAARHIYNMLKNCGVLIRLIS